MDDCLFNKCIYINDISIKTRKYIQIVDLDIWY